MADSSGTFEITEAATLGSIISAIEGAPTAISTGSVASVLILLSTGFS